MSEPAPAISTSPADEQLRAAEATNDFKHRSARGGVVMILNYGTQVLIGIIGTAILARMLDPRDFGYLAMVMTFANFIIPFREFLLAPAAFNQELSHEQASGLFWINALFSVVVAGTLALAAPVLKWFFAEPKMLGIVLVMSIGVLVNMLSMLHVGILRRRLQFGAITLIEVGAMIASVIFAVWLAKHGAGYWALVLQQLTIWVWQGVAAWLICPWRPAPIKQSLFRGDANVTSILKYGRHVAVARMLMYVGRNIDNMVIGHFVGATVLGLYQKSYQWAMMPFWQIYIPMGAVVVSIFGRLRDDPPRYRNYVRTTLLGVFAFVLPLTALMYVEADHVVLFLLGDKWVDGIPMLRILSVGAYFSSFAIVTTWLYMSEGRTVEQFWWALFTSAAIAGGVLIGIKWSAIGVAVGFTIASIIVTLPSIWYCLRRSPLTGEDFLKASWRAITASVIAGIALTLLRPTLPVIPNLTVHLAVNCSMYLLIYAVLWIALPGGWSDCRIALTHLPLSRPRQGLE